MKVFFACPSCEAQAHVALAAPVDWQCPACEHRHHFDPADATLPACALCGNHELYKQKDFPQRLGMFILIAPIVVSIFTYGWYAKWLTWALLIGSAIVDCVLYLLVGDAIVCYRCHAYHTGFPQAKSHEPFEITIGERYRQERLRKEQIRSQEPC